MRKILALDQSLSCTGVCQVDDEVAGQPQYNAYLYKPKHLGAERLITYQRWLRNLMYEQGTDALVIEGYAFGRPQGMAALGELGGVIKVTAADTGIPVFIIAPMQVKKWAAGKGNATKDEVLCKAVSRFGEMISDNNAADACFLAEIAYHLVHGIPGKNAAQRSVLDALNASEEGAKEAKAKKAGKIPRKVPH